MPNIMIPAKDVAQHFIAAAEATVTKNFPDIPRDSVAFGETVAAVLLETFNPLFDAPMKMG